MSSSAAAASKIVVEKLPWCLSCKSFAMWHSQDGITCGNPACGEALVKKFRVLCSFILPAANHFLEDPRATLIRLQSFEDEAEEIKSLEDEVSHLEAENRKLKRKLDSLRRVAEDFAKRCAAEL